MVITDWLEQRRKEGIIVERNGIISLTNEAQKYLKKWLCFKEACSFFLLNGVHRFFFLLVK
ncbi:hypothetical protein ACUXCC_001762 [Cytobacillus horneckiae]|uniref:Uncharacterized protein n=1 Tax=Cytobacillus horneckiae TaxID=549687 RepID=A0A2N0ZA54_9BACI|nr:hypothetical protein [Cytobacillus horneckiae]MBN6886768.1 hypothetical protein [Cytobacillus horneckiae]MEC1158077.1 hypothetical protein [Cytobacillus horneckiae]MED2936998.1 hypothetical protein [Cytobacillus horneckiae]PKG26394.1 hypothetical protein CWS20_24135 [Cytobacillus horneckiae]